MSLPVDKRLFMLLIVAENSLVLGLQFLRFRSTRRFDPICFRLARAQSTRSAHCLELTTCTMNVCPCGRHSSTLECRIAHMNIRTRLPTPIDPRNDRVNSLRRLIRFAQHGLFGLALFNNDAEL
jgi:hypothetical protein